MYEIRTHELRLDVEINDQLSAMVGYYDFGSELEIQAGHQQRSTAP